MINNYPHPLGLWSIRIIRDEVKNELDVLAWLDQRDFRLRWLVERVLELPSSLR